VKKTFTQVQFLGYNTMKYKETFEEVETLE